MSTGIKIKGGGGHILSWNLVVGTDIGIDMEDSWNNFLQGNIHVSKEALKVYGEEIVDVAEAVQKSHDPEALLALANILTTSPDNAVAAWAILVKKLGGVRIGRFSLNVLSGILSNAAYSLLKMALKSHGIDLP